MANNKKAIKERIRSIRSTKKITSAMEVIANAKLAKQRNQMEKNREYANILKDLIADIMATNKDIESPFLAKRDGDRTYWLVIGSDLGLCGAYNINVVKLLKERYKDVDKVIAIGNKLRPLLVKDEITTVLTNDIEKTTLEDIKRYMQKMIEAYLSLEVDKICVIYTRFNNAVSFEPMVYQVLPYEKRQGQEVELIYDPDRKTVLDELIRMSTESVTYSLLQEAKIAEQASRRMAMQNANDNADELQEELTLAYNQARQASITQEITEIIAGADAL